MDIYTSTRGEFTLSTDPSQMDAVAIHDYLCHHSYWAKNIPFERVEKSIRNSLNFGIFHEERQIAYARIISDFSTIAYLGDVYVLEAYRGRGLSKWLMETLSAHPELQGLRRWLLGTRDAHELYAQYGWKPMASPERWMEKHNPEVYR
ncbi:MAG: N-acetyltransferase [Bacteroidetes bacterium]|nr:MAG: N-acetyltransferase [Bacteroidota bacterium]